MVNNADVEIPTQRPDESFAEKPAMPSLTPQRKVPRALTSLRVSPARMDGGAQPATVSVTAAQRIVLARARVCTTGRMLARAGYINVAGPERRHLLPRRCRYCTAFVRPASKIFFS